MRDDDKPQYSIPQGQDPPELGDTIQSAKACEKWAHKAVLLGWISPQQAKEALSACSKVVTAVVAENGLRELDELRELVRRSQDLYNKRKELEVAARFATGDKPVKFPIEIAAEGPYRKSKDP